MKIGLGGWLAKIFAPLAERILGSIEPVVSLFRGLKLPSNRNQIVSAIRESKFGEQLAGTYQSTLDEQPYPIDSMIDVDFLGSHRYMVQFNVKILRNNKTVTDEIRRVYYEKNYGADGFMDRYIKDCGAGYQKYSEQIISAQVDKVFHNPIRSY